MEYPQYRKSKSGNSFFKITSGHSFIELQIVGQRHFVYAIEARTMPEHHLLNDLLYDYDHHWDKITAQEFHQLLETFKIEIEHTQ